MTSPIAGTAGTAWTPTYGADAATGTGASASTTSDTSDSTKSSSSASMLDPQAFLQLLVAQLQYQDPTNPTDTSTFMNQTAMLSQVQTMNSMSSTLTSLVSSQQTQAATAMIGKQITWIGTGGLRTTGTVDSASLLATGATLQVGATDVPLASVVQVSDAAH